MPDDFRLRLPAAERRRPVRKLGPLGPSLRGSKKAPAKASWFTRVRHGFRLRGGQAFSRNVDGSLIRARKAVRLSLSLARLLRLLVQRQPQPRR